MIIRHDLEQGSDEWFDARAGLITASEADNIVDSKWEPRTGDTIRTYVYRKIAESWTGPQIAWSSGSAEQGSLKETRAIPYLKLEYGWDIEQVGLVTDESGRYACSPDGLVGDSFACEIKCPEGTNHVRYLLGNCLPKSYQAQVHFSMLVTGFRQWRFISYRPSYPTLVILVDRDEVIQSKLREALQATIEKIDAGLERLTELAKGDLPSFRRKRLGI